MHKKKIIYTKKIILVSLGRNAWQSGEGIKT